MHPAERLIIISRRTNPLVVLCCPRPAREPGPTLMRGRDRVRQVQLPCAATAVRDEHGEMVCENCRAFATPAMEAGDVLLYEIDIAC